MPRPQRRAPRLVLLLFALSILPLSPLAQNVRAETMPASRMVAYLDRDRNLWVSQDNGTEPRQVTTSGGFTSFVWSRDGSRIALANTSGGSPSVSIASPDRNFGVRALHYGTDPAWAPNSTRLAFIDGGTIHVFDRDGVYVRSVSINASTVRWSPDSRHIGFSRVVADPYDTHCETRQLGWVDADTGVVTIGPRSIGKFAWSGDGRRLLYVSADDGGIWSYDIANESARPLSGRSANPCGGPFFTTPDGRTLVFLDYRNGANDLVLLNLETGQEKVFHDLPVGYPSHTLPESYVSVDVSGRYAYTVQAYPTTVTRVDLESGARTTIIQSDYRMFLGFSPRHDRLALLNAPTGAASIVTVRDVATGEEVEFSDVGWLAWMGSAITPMTILAWDRVWDREDRPVAEGTATRTWIWGPEAFATREERYDDSPGGRRAVRYYDKSRMEVTNPAGDTSSRWYVTNGLLAKELITGQVQVGDADFVDRQPAEIPVAGDPDDPNGPAYASLTGLLDAPSTPTGTEIRATVDRTGNVGSGGPGGVVAGYFVPETNHTIADVFWEYLNSQGPLWDGANYVEGRLFDPTFFATGFPVTEAYWARVKVGGEVRDVLMQCFERRCLTYTPSNPEGWKVEMGNVGRHYHEWRYGG